MNDETLRGWVDLLDRIRSRYPSAILAGGALRDLDNDRPVKDLDIFVNELADPSVVEHMTGYTCSSTAPGQYIDAAREVECSYKFVAPTKINQPDEINLIQLRSDFDVYRVIERVDFGLCQIALVAGNVIKTDLYRTDKQHQQFTLTRAESVAGVKRSLHRYDRLKAKYEGWPLVIPPKYVSTVQEALLASRS